MNKFLSLLLFLTMAYTGMGQTIVTGAVVDVSQAPLPGVTVLVQGTNHGTVTDFDGNYSIAVKEGEILEFSYIGFRSKQIKVQESTIIDVVLEEDVQALSEVVVVGFGTQKKVNLSGAVSNVSVEQMATRPINNVTQGLQGISPGLNIDFTSGAPGANPKINIRGFTSINGGDPLVLIDNIPSDVSYLNQI
ncbi:MAG: carboxypeptidase-like regulatory domain-containing protein, partial [Arenibacter latericius]|nr:carboxypeptidase-like regulatory domain-containing protein [Arenibacter latericius]